MLEATVEALCEAAACAPQQLQAWLGPCIGPLSYEVGLEFLNRFEADAPGSGVFFQPGSAEDKRLFDLPAFVLERLRALEPVPHAPDRQAALGVIAGIAPTWIFPEVPDCSACSSSRICARFASTTRACRIRHSPKALGVTPLGVRSNSLKPRPFSSSPRASDTAG